MNELKQKTIEFDCFLAKQWISSWVFTYLYGSAGDETYTEGWIDDLLKPNAINVIPTLNLLAIIDVLSLFHTKYCYKQISDHLFGF